MTTFTSEHTTYPVQASVISSDGLEVQTIHKARLTLLDGNVGLYDANVAAPYVFAVVLEAPVVDGVLYFKGGGVEAVLEDGRIVRASAPTGCGCGDKGKKYLYPANTPSILLRS
jgi:hypothetical protein